MSAGLVLIDKSPDWTSHDVVAKLRKIAGTKKVGHAGTLDPMATGLLLLGINAGTKFLTYLVGADKTYLATIRLGQTTVSDDKESDFTSQASTEEIAKITDAQIAAEITKLTGKISQVPSSVSAIKVDGVRAYAAVRAGEEVALKAREVTVSRFEITAPIKRSENFIDVDVEVDCSSGTYIRALARDLGAALGIGGHLVALRRTRIGAFEISQAATLESVTSENLSVIPLAKVASAMFETKELSDQEVTDIRHGKKIAGSISGLCAAVDSTGELVALLEPAGGQIKSALVFAAI